MRPLVVLRNDMASVSIDLAGGSIAGFQLKGSDINPLNWDSAGSSPAPSTKPRAMGHFLCLDRWGQATDAEYRNGMSYHGEASQVLWNPTETNRVPAETRMETELPIAGFRVIRSIRLNPGRSVFSVTETVVNRNKLGRIYNMVQHPSIGGIFLDETTLVDSNARQGFMQASPMPHPEDPSVVWPQAVNRDGLPVNMRRLQGDSDPNVVSYVCDEKHGWVTAVNSRQGLMLGYIWSTEDYPWVSFWRHSEGGKPAARGLEFGTTGLHQTFGVLVKKGSIFGRPLVAYLDAGESASRSYTCFLVQVPVNYRGVARLELRKGRWIALEREGGESREMEVAREADLDSKP